MAVPLQVQLKVWYNGNMEQTDIYWLAGVLEGEGCFKLNRRSPQIALAMTDQDVIERAAVLLGSQVSQWALRPTQNKPLFFTGVQGLNAVQWMRTLYPLMGQRRQAKIDSVIDSWKPKNGFLVNSVCGHRDLPYCAKGMCSTCYHRQKTQKLRARKRGDL